MRIDKFLKNSRIIKRRTIAKEACEQGRVSINDKKAKPGDVVKVNDVISIEFGSGTMKIQVMETKENVKKSEATNLYKNID